MKSLGHSPRILVGTCAALVLTAGTAAQPPSVTYELSWKSIPSGWPTFLNNLESAQLVMTARVWPPIGTVINSPLPGGGVGTVAGLGSVVFDIRGCQSNFGTWTLSGSGFSGTTGNTWGIRSGWTTGSSAGFVQAGGDLANCSAGQFVAPDSTANATNPVAEIWRAKWTPNGWLPGKAYRFNVVPISSFIVVRVIVDGVPSYAGLQVQGIPSIANIIVDPGSPDPCLPNVSTAPQSTVGYIGHPASFSVSAIPGTCAPLTYQWRKGCTNLVDDGRITGATSPTLRFNSVIASDAGQYDISLNGSQAQLLAPPVWLTLGGCYANCDQSTAPPTLNANDFQCFLNQYASGNSNANCDGSSAAPVLNANDFQCFLNAYASGCS